MQTIQNNTDLNNVTANGWYRCTGSTSAATLSHCPTGAAFIMYVGPKSTGIYEQLILGVSSNAPVMFLRHKTTSAWSSWYKFEGTEVT